MINTGEYDADLARYIPGMLELVFQEMIENISSKEQFAHISYKDVETFEFQLMLTNNCYTNPNSIHICFQMKIKKLTNATSDIVANLITANNFSAHLIKEIRVTRYGNDKQLIPTFSPYETYQYPDAIPKHLPENALKNCNMICFIAKKQYVIIRQRQAGEYTIAQRQQTWQTKI